MHDLPLPESTNETAGPMKGPWFKELTRYHWFVLFVAALGWLFDTMDQQLFALARTPAMKELLRTSSGPAPNELVSFYGAVSTAIFLIGWATGGMFFGSLGDRIGRAKTMMLTILMYSICTGLSALSVSVWDFAFYRFITGLGVGGEFAVGVSLVAEVMPSRARPFALALLQALSAVGNITAAVITYILGDLEQAEYIGGWWWRLAFLVGALPALLAVLIRGRLKEPERWTATTSAAQAPDERAKVGSYAALFSDPTLRKHALLGMVLACAGVIGVWGIGFFSADLIREVLRPAMNRQALADGRADGDIKLVAFAASHFDVWSKSSIKANDRQLIFDEHTPELKSSSKNLKAIYKAASAMKKADSTNIQVTRDAVLGQAVAILRGTKSNDSSITIEKLADLVRDVPESDVKTMEELSKTIVARSGKIDGQLTKATGINSMMQNAGAFFGMFSFAYLSYWFGRRPTFFVMLLVAMVATALFFRYFDDYSHIFWMTPILGFCQLSLFGGYALYLPELFPTRLRSTGTSFCYNVGRYVAATGPFGLGLLTSQVFAHTDFPYRWAGMTMSLVYLVGLFVLPSLPETRGRPLPE